MFYKNIFFSESTSNLSLATIHSYARYLEQTSDDPEFDAETIRRLLMSSGHMKDESEQLEKIKTIVSNLKNRATSKITIDSNSLSINDMINSLKTILNSHFMQRNPADSYDFYFPESILKQIMDLFSRTLISLNAEITAGSYIPKTGEGSSELLSDTIIMSNVFGKEAQKTISGMKKTGKDKISVSLRKTLQEYNSFQAYQMAHKLELTVVCLKSHRNVTPDNILYSIFPNDRATLITSKLTAAKEITTIIDFKTKIQKTIGAIAYNILNFKEEKDRDWEEDSQVHLWDHKTNKDLGAFAIKKKQLFSPIDPQICINQDNTRIEAGGSNNYFVVSLFIDNNILLGSTLIKLGNLSFSKISEVEPLLKDIGNIKNILINTIEDSIEKYETEKTLIKTQTKLTEETQKTQELEKKLDQLEKVLEKTNKDRILKTIFHSLKGYLQTLQINKQNDNETREKIKNSTTTLHNSIKNLDLKHKEIENIFEELFKELALLEEKNQLLDKAIFKSIPKYIHVNRERLNGNMIVFSEEPVALSTVYSDTVDDFTSVLKMHNITALPLKTHIRALKLQNIIDTSLHDILIILFTNSIEAFLQAGELGRDKEIKCLTSQGKRNNKNFTVVRFIDNGLGVPDDLKEKIFERGFSTKKEQNQDNTLTNKDLGNSGIGLDDIKSYMEAIGGFIREVGTYGEGAEFQLWFPEENQAEAAAKEETVAQKNIEQISELVHNKRILLAEDNDNIRESLANELRKFNLVVETASDGLHGYEMITQNNNYDLIITDIDMPDLKGNDMILKLYQNNYKVPFIFASDLFSEEKGLAFYNLRKPFRTLGINEIPSFSKPLDMNALILKVEEILLKTVVSAAEEKN